ncbi:hypothetical protein BCR34DRAFT_144250 [Clohesyomyces aquaticus]|uniref:F-box domain-containing protein n=1 Tax=Clohesyomyces aquaticus TaxID=1231657 RepID=A0A1Y2A0P2_9PLEO|nr:hypothetical protein BCR34DRAFT_144250 [Clohesyomyces aquaticus]
MDTRLVQVRAHFRINDSQQHIEHLLLLPTSLLLRNISAMQTCASRRFQRIAHDLEKLPVELHEAVLADLEFHQLIRLSQCAGPRLTWSLENSLLPWGKFFRPGSMPKWRNLLVVSDQIKRLCFKPSKTPDKEPHLFSPEENWRWVNRHGALLFLHNRSSDWKGRNFYKPAVFADPDIDCKKLEQHWHVTLKAELYQTGKMEATEDNALPGLTKLWLPRLPHLLEEEGETPAKISCDLCKREEETVRTLIGNYLIFGSDLSVEKMAAWIHFYQQLRLEKAEAMAAELHRLADIYSAHPTRLKTPWAPQSSRPNPKHVPNQMQREARKLIRRAKHSWWGDQVSRYRFAVPFPGLVPYDWCMEFFVKVMRKQSSWPVILPADILEKCQTVIKRRPPWVTVEVGTMPTTSQLELDEALGAMRIGPETVTAMLVLTKGQEKQRKVTHRDGTPDSRFLRATTQTQTETKGMNYSVHDTAELAWLETFMEVIVWMEGEFPELLEEARGLVLDRQA